MLSKRSTGTTSVGARQPCSVDVFLRRKAAADLWLAVTMRRCSNRRYSWVTYFILSNLCYFSQLVLSTHPLLLHQFLSPYQSFAVLSNFCHLLALCYLLAFYFIYVPYKCTCCTHDKHNSYSRLIVRTLSAPIYLSNSPGVFGHRAILIWGGGRDMSGGIFA